MWPHQSHLVFILFYFIFQWLFRYNLFTTLEKIFGLAIGGSRTTFRESDSLQFGSWNSVKSELNSCKEINRLQQFCFNPLQLEFSSYHRATLPLLHLLEHYTKNYLHRPRPTLTSSGRRNLSSRYIHHGDFNPDILVFRNFTYPDFFLTLTSWFF